MIELRPYQSVAIEDLRNGFRNSHVRQVLCAPTGAGKSVTALDMLRSAVEKGSKVGFFCERRVLVEQFSRHLDSIGIDHGVMMASHWRYRPQAPVQVASIQTLERMEALPWFDVVFIDEIHAAMRKSVIQLMETRPSLKIIGMTATPFHPAMGKHFTRITNVTTMADLVAEGFLVPFRVFVAHEIDTKGLKIVAGEWNKGELEQRGVQIVGDVVTDYLRLTNEVYGGTVKTICFSAGVAHGAELSRKFAEAGVNAIQISYKDDEDYKAEVLAEFAKPDTEIDMVISSDILTRGFDQPDVRHVILARPLRKSFSSHVQMVGRGARIYDGKEFCSIQDHSNNWLRFLNDWNELYYNGVNRLMDADTKPRKEPNEREKEAGKCPKCSAVWPAKSDTCLHCGFVRQRRNDVLNLPGEMKELGDAKPKYDSATKERWYRELLGYARNKGYQDGWAFHAYQSKMGVQPAWQKVPEEPSQEVLNWIRYRAIAYAKKKAA